ncbi:Succinyl-CoA ligase [ADP-forming] subunit alpha [Achromobacter insolitus]|uniref:acetate--CoA ligase family protein n=1 Tax=Achromobacter insolitus TaxID=217204 RepID=UPI000972DDF8|nr:acetate--CoA ligase family protein [Achromobacter insolitus]APX78446.1 6-carboxyhexanoate--CoA ligase [Achromobacter insolitus]OWT62939.1 6-carboxyhexanoate--CoA ligase [Achromobacter insolitus]CAB3652474.1 Trans-feruloyl-CoA synthase FCS1 [Achromobacter insolitus]VEG66086.1 Succinyl-CoA ligase [ADP-forming] subunit alpha [Achromobacter insolitus]
MTQLPDPSLSRLFDPQGIAIVGASATPGKIGAMPITLLLQHGYSGRIIPVNPRADIIAGLPALPGLDALDDAVDLAILAVPAAHAAQALERARPGQVGAAVVFTSGFSETGSDGAAQQERLCAIARERGIRLLGPNCLGFMNVRRNVYATFSPAPANGVVAPGGIGMVSQSGAFGAYAYSMARERGLGLSHWISTGNEADIDVADCIEWLARDTDTRVIMAYMEGCRDGAKLRRALAAARNADKPVVVTKIGRTQAGAQAAASHTAALAGDDAVYDALFRQYGALRARTIEEFFNLGYALDTWKRPPQGRRLGIFTISGGVGALMADEAADTGLALPEPAADAQARLLQRVPFASGRNPVDVTGQAVSEPGLLLATADDMLADGRYDALAVFLAAAGSSEALWPTFEAFARQMQARHPGVPLAISALFPPARRRELERLGCLVFPDPSAAIRTIGAVAGLGSGPAPGVVEASPATADAGALPLLDAYNEVQAMELLRQAGLPASPCVLAGDADAAVRAAASLGAACVLKVVSPDITHKSDVGGVKLNVQGDDALRSAYADILAAVRQHRPDARIDGVLVAPMAPKGVECIAGVHCDPVFGPVVMFGLGGVFVEVLKDVSFRLAPFGRDDALAMIREIKGYALLQGARGAPPCDIGALAEALAALSRFAHARRADFSSVEINPLLALPEGQGVVALDAVVIRADA